MFFRLKRTKADALFSEYIRLRANWRCERCFIDCDDNKGYLDCSHYWSRGKKSVRFDPDNASALCKKCHDFFTGKNKEDHEAMFVKRLGQKKFDLLMLRAFAPAKVDEKYICLWLKEEIAKMKEPVYYRESFHAT